LESKLGPIRHAGHFWPIVYVPGDCEDGEFGGVKIGWGRKTCPSANLSATDPGANSGRRGGNPETNRLSYGAAFHRTLPTNRKLKLL
jgi:hypothetical protein